MYVPLETQITISPYLQVYIFPHDFDSVKLRMIRSFIELASLMESPHRSLKDKMALMMEVRTRFHTEYLEVARVFQEHDACNLERASRSLDHMRTIVKNFSFSRKLEQTCAYPGYLQQREESVQYLRLFCQTISDLGMKIVPYYKTREFPIGIDPRILLHADSILLSSEQPNASTTKYLIRGLSAYCDLDCLKRLRLQSSENSAESLITQMEVIIECIRGSNHDQSYASIKRVEVRLSHAIVDFMSAYNEIFA